MWRAFFWAIGVYSCLLGAQFLVTEKTVLKRGGAANRGVMAQSSQREIKPPDWVPWSLFSFGAVTLIYSFTLPKRGGD